MSEIDFETSFRVALKFLKYYALWLGAGFILEFLGFWLMAPIAIKYEFGSLAWGLALIMLGIVVQLFGFLATFFKTMYSLVYEVAQTLVFPQSEKETFSKP